MRWAVEYGARFVVCVSTFAVWLVALSASQGAAMTLEELIAAYEKSLAVMERVEFTCSGKTYVQGSLCPNERLIQDDTLFCRRDGVRWRIREHMKGTYLDDKSGKWLPAESELEYVAPGQGTMHVQHEPTEWIVSASLGAKAPGFLPPEAYLGHLAILVGILPPDLRLSRLLREVRPEIRRVSVEGKEMWFMEGKGRYGELRVWLDPAAGFLPHRIESFAKGKDLLGGADAKPVESVRGSGGYDPKASLESVHFTVDQFKYQRIGNSYVACAFSVLLKQRYAGNQTTNLRTTFSLSDIKINPDRSANAFAVTMNIPEGTDVEVVDAPRIRYKWSKGKVVKVVHRRASEIARNAWFRTTLSSGRFWACVGSVGAVLGFLGYVGWARWKRRAAH